MLLGEIMRRKSCLFFVIVALLFLTACSTNKKKDPVVLTIWHVYGGQTDSPLNHMIEEFNNTVGLEKGINVQVTSISNTNTIHEAVLSAAKGDPGASELPDMFVAYPKTVLSLPDKDILVDYNNYFNKDELENYIPEFIEEGKIDNKLLVFPVAKSTEILFVNKTLFDRFSADTGAKVEDLQTWEGLYKMSKEYTKWTDEQTSDIPGDGKAFFVHDYHFNYFQVGVESMGERFFYKDDEDGSIYFSDSFKKAWDPYADAAIAGGIWLREGYATEPLRTGKVIVSVASSASVLYYEDIVTYDDNVSEPIEVIAFPVPIFEGGEKLVMQRGAGICTIKSNPEKEKAAADFLKWLTDANVNVDFVTQAGYMPVAKKSFDILPEKIEELENAKYKSLYKALLETQNSYRFYTAPKLPRYLDLEMRFEKNVRLELMRQKEEFDKVLSENEEQGSVSEEQFIEQGYENIKKIMK